MSNNDVASQLDPPLPMLGEHFWRAAIDMKAHIILFNFFTVTYEFVVLILTSANQTSSANNSFRITVVPFVGSSSFFSETFFEHCINIKYFWCAILWNSSQRVTQFRHNRKSYKKLYKFKLNVRIVCLCACVCLWGFVWNRNRNRKSQNESLTLSNVKRLSNWMGPIVFGSYGCPYKITRETMHLLLHAAQMIWPLFVTPKSLIIL